MARQVRSLQSEPAQGLCSCDTTTRRTVLPGLRRRSLRRGFVPATWRQPLGFIERAPCPTEPAQGLCSCERRIAIKMRTLVMLAALVVAPAEAIVNGHAPADYETSHDAVGAIGFAHRLGLDPSHPNASDHEWHCAATLVSSLVVVTAKHCVTTPEHYAVRFRRHVSGSVGSIYLKGGSVDSFHHVRITVFYMPPSGDVALGYLAEPVTHIQRIPMLLSGSAAVCSANFAGWGRVGPGQGEGDKIELRVCHWALSGASSTEVYWQTPWNGGPCGPNRNDSGAPVLQQTLNGTAIVGTVSGYNYGAALHQYANDPYFVAVGHPRRR
jgi:hypothetical protein